MNLIEAREIPRNAYSEFLETVPHSVFHRLEWLAVVERIYPVKVFPLGYFQDDKLVAVTPLLRRRFGPFVLWGAPLRKCPVPPATPFCAPVGMAGVALAALREWSRRRRIGYLQATLPSTDGLTDVASKRIEVLENLELRLSVTLEELWQPLSKKARYTVRRAIKDGVKVHWRSSTSILDTQSQLLSDTYGRQGQGIRPNYPLVLYRALLEVQSNIGLRILCASHRGKIIATAWLFTDIHKCYYWDAAACGEGRRLNANHLLVWCLIHWAHQRSLKTLDFVGARGGRGGTRPGIGRFKRSMGAQTVEYRVIFWYSFVLGTALAVYRALSRFRHRVFSNWRKAADGDN